MASSLVNDTDNLNSVIKELIEVAEIFMGFRTLFNETKETNNNEKDTLVLTK